MRFKLECYIYLWLQGAHQTNGFTWNWLVHHSLWSGSISCWNQTSAVLNPQSIYLSHQTKIAAHTCNRLGCHGRHWGSVGCRNSTYTGHHCQNAHARLRRTPCSEKAGARWKHTHLSWNTQDVHIWTQVARLWLLYSMLFMCNGQF